MKYIEESVCVCLCECVYDYSAHRGWFYDSDKCCRLNEVEGRKEKQFFVCIGANVFITAPSCACFINISSWTPITKK